GTKAGSHDMTNWKLPTRTCPVPPGRSSFRVKGHGLIARMAIYDHIVPGGKRAVLAAIPDAAVRDYLSRPLLAAEWYDLFAHAALDIAAADLRHMQPWESVASASATQAQNDAAGIYAILLKFVSPYTVCKKLGAITAQYFDHGTIEVERLDTHAARLTRTG